MTFVATVNGFDLDLELLGTLEAEMASRIIYFHLTPFHVQGVLYVEF